MALPRQDHIGMKTDTCRSKLGGSESTPWTGGQAEAAGHRGDRGDAERRHRRADAGAHDRRRGARARADRHHPHRHQLWCCSMDFYSFLRFLTKAPVLIAITHIATSSGAAQFCFSFSHFLEEARYYINPTTSGSVGRSSFERGGCPDAGFLLESIHIPQSDNMETVVLARNIDLKSLH